LVTIKLRNVYSSSCFFCRFQLSN